MNADKNQTTAISMAVKKSSKKAWDEEQDTNLLAMICK